MNKKQKQIIKHWRKIRNKLIFIKNQNEKPLKCEVCNKEITPEEAIIIFSVYFCKECEG